MSKDRILVVDDEDRIRELIKEYVEQNGYRIDEASNGRVSVKLL
jgi:DNA-binding response OmpR family regulator